MLIYTDPYQTLCFHLLLQMTIRSELLPAESHKKNLKTFGGFQVRSMILIFAAVFRTQFQKKNQHGNTCLTLTTKYATSEQGCCLESLWLNVMILLLICINQKQSSVDVAMHWQLVEWCMWILRFCKWGGLSN